MSEQFEMIIAAFEHAWLREGRAEIAEFLGHVSDSLVRDRLLHELILIDVEIRWRRGEQLRLDDYLCKFPELGPLDSLPVEMIGQEYRVRQRWGDRPSHSTFLARFESKRHHLRDELRRIDEELKLETATPHLTRATVPAMSESWSLTDLPRVSHDHFLLKRLIGAGRMGKVYEAQRIHDHATVAVKFLRRELLSHTPLVDLFLYEAATVARLRHERIVSIHGIGRTPGGSCFLVMDHVNGPNLDQVIRQRSVSICEAVDLAIDLSEGLEHAHHREVVHCDLKPANLLLDREFGLRITDFGLARSSLTAGRTEFGAIEGTAPFMAPEQVSPVWGEVDERTDIYGIGAVLYNLLTLRPPWVGRSLPDVLWDVVSRKRVTPVRVLRPDLPDAVAQICDTCLAKSPGDRFSSVSQLLRFLRESAKELQSQLPDSPVV